MSFDAAGWPWWLSVAVFAVAGAAIWRAGTRLAHLADTIAKRTGAGEATVGVLLLATVTSLPEIAVGTTATLQGTPLLSVNDILGSTAANVVLLAMADAVLGRRHALTATPASPEVLLQGVLSMLLMLVVVACVTAGDRVFLGIGIWSWLILAGYAGALYVLAHSRTDQAWKPARKTHESKDDKDDDERPSWRIALATVGAGAVICFAGFLLAKTGDALAQKSGLGHSFFGAVVLAYTTSLPEVSTLITVIRLRRYEMALAEIFGTNLFNMTILVWIDALHPKGPILLEAGRFAAFAALLGMTLTGIYLVGILERRDRVVLRMGLDSLAILVVYAVGLVVLYALSTA